MKSVKLLLALSIIILNQQKILMMDRDFAQYTLNGTYMVSMATHYTTLKNAGVPAKYSYLSSNSS